MHEIEALQAKHVTAIAETTDLTALDAIRVAALGKKGEISGLMKNLGKMEPEARREAGQHLNKLKTTIAKAIDARKAELTEAELNTRLKAEAVDITLATRPKARGCIHPISRTLDEMVAIFADMGFSVAEGPDVENDFNNFTALNIPEEHPARQMHDTFYMPGLAEGSPLQVLRTHTSPVQIRHMARQQPPIRVIAPGRVFRSDYDMTHTPMFHQVEGLVVDQATHMGHLKGTVIEFLKAFFGIENLAVRFRPSFFPFTEPSVEVDIGCSRKNGELKIGGDVQEDWLEVMGCGMVHANVLKNCGINPDIYQGFAFGMGVERLAMLKYGIPDIRSFFESDTRWLTHYGFNPLKQANLALGLTD